MCDIVDTTFCHCVPVRMLAHHQIIVHVSEGTMPWPGTEAVGSQSDSFTIIIIIIIIILLLLL